MKTNYFQEILLTKVLIAKHNTANVMQGVIEDAIENNKDLPIPIKNVCAKLPVELSDQLDNVCSILKIQKRKFIEMALINAIGEFEKLSEEYNLPQYEPKQEDSSNA